MGHNLGLTCETARGGLAVNVLEVADLSVGLPEC
jgi:hypothetical protein